MELPVQITFRNLEPSALIEGWVSEEAEKLEKFYSHIIGCRVAIEFPHRHHRKGKPCHIRIDLTLPGKELVIKREPMPSSKSRKTKAELAGKVTKVEPHHDLHLALHEAFKAAGRRVQDYARLQRGDIKASRQSLELAT